MFARKSADENVCWMCRNRQYDKNACASKQISEKEVYAGFVNAYNRLKNNMEYILTPLLKSLNDYKEIRLRGMSEVNDINREIASLTEQILVQEKARAEGYLESALFIEQRNILSARIAKLKKDKKLLLGTDECDRTIRKTEALISIIQMNGSIGEFDGKLFKRTVSKVWIDKDKNIIYELTNGLKITVNEVN